MSGARSRRGDGVSVSRRVLEQLWRHGIRPVLHQPPELVHEFISDLYRFELRRLRERLVRKEIPEGRLLRSCRRAAPQVSAGVHEAARVARVVCVSRSSRTDGIITIDVACRPSIRSCRRRRQHLRGDDAAGQRARRHQPVAGVSRLRLRAGAGRRRGAATCARGTTSTRRCPACLALREALATKIERLYGRRYDPGDRDRDHDRRDRRRCSPR